MAWRPLPLSPSASEHLPPLLIFAHFSKNTYAIYLTDLTHIWSESLDKTAIIRRGRDEGTTIDPSQGDDQFQIFLAKIKLGLEAGDGTTLALTVNPSTERPSFTLKVSVALPGGLVPLVWQIQLAASSQSDFTNQFTIPLLGAQHVHMQETASLVKVLRDKDHIIQKLMDRLESQNKDFHDLFPQPSGRVRKVDRQQAEERVKGLGVFGMDTWKKGLGLHPPRDVADLMGQVFVAEEAGHDTAVVLKTEIEEDWWSGIKGVTVNLGSGKISTNGAIDKPDLATRPVMRKENRAEDDEDDAFQVQVLPGHHTHAEDEVMHDESTDEEDLDAPSHGSRVPDSFPTEPTQTSPPKPKQPLGKLGGKKVPSRPKSPIIEDTSTEDEDDLPHKPATRGAHKPQPTIDEDVSTADEAPSSPKRKPASPVKKTTPKSTRKLGKIGGKKEAAPPPPEPEPESESEKEAPAPSSTPATKPKKGKLGKIGGKKKTIKPEPEPEPPNSPSPKPEPVTPRKKQLGVIHGHKYDASQSQAEEERKLKEEEESQRGRAAMREKTKTPEVRETSADRALRRARELREELQEKAKAAPKKKKRKF